MYDIIIGRDKSDKKKFGKKGLVYLGKGYVQMGNYVSLSNKIWLDVARSHVILICGKRGCLTSDTLIFTNRGYLPISEFKEKSDKVYSFNPEDRRFELENAQLLKYKTFPGEKLLEIETESKKKIKLTKEHPLLTLVQIKDSFCLLWKKAEVLKIRDILLCANDPHTEPYYESIKKIREIDPTEEVYDLFVKKNHSFIANGIISHNSGKSYSIGVLAEELSDLPEETKTNISSLIFDTMGIFWTMKFKNTKENDLLEEWSLKAKEIPITIWTPYGYFAEYEKRGIPVEKKFALKVSELDIEDWISTFELKIIDAVSILIQKVILKLKGKGDYDLDDIIKCIKEEGGTEDTKEAAVALFEAAKSWKVFARKEEESTKIEELAVAGKTTVLDLSVYPSTSAFNIRALIIGIVSRKLFEERTLSRKKEEIEEIRYGLSKNEKKEMPLVWIFIDEAHEFLGNEKTPATNSLSQLLKEGRQPGISLILATQQPGVLHRDVMTQSDIIISHRLTNKKDLEALNEIMQSYFVESIQKSMNSLPDLKGSAIVLDDSSERLYPIRIRPRFTWHGGETPKILKENQL